MADWKLKYAENTTDVFVIIIFVIIRCTILFNISFLLGVYTVRSSDRPVGPTGLSDWSVRRSYRVNASFDRSDRRSDV